MEKYQRGWRDGAVPAGLMWWSSTCGIDVVKRLRVVAEDGVEVEADSQAGQALQVRAVQQLLAAQNVTLQGQRSRSRSSVLYAQP